ncbi:MAG TPA: site-specific integrase [Verrucomicrobiae bacterium]|nr:site-specific integrase [Verrucomicrobiae bacterium]
MKAESTGKTWEPTRLQNLVRHKSGRYYARLYLNGKEIWKSLKTSHFSVAEAKLADQLKEHRERKTKQIDPANAKMTFGQATTLHMKRVDENVSLKRRTRVYWKETLGALNRSWTELANIELRGLTQNMLREWAARYAQTTSASRYNHTLSLVSNIIKIAIENGILYSNPASILKRKPIRAKQLELPTRAQFAAFIPEMQAGKGRDSKNCADLAQGLAFTGCRKSEAAQMEWRDLDFTNGDITVKGDPEENTKNGEIRHVPMIPQARLLFEKMREKRADEAPTAKVFLVRECQKSINRAATKVGMTRITHHDLRHFFATICIESGVDIPTVSRWLGHKDGGALAMKTYGHLRREHSVAQAQKVSFACLAA